MIKTEKRLSNLLILHGGILSLLGVYDVLDRGQVITFLEHVFHENIKEFSFAICFLELAWGTVANWRVPKQRV